MSENLASVKLDEAEDGSFKIVLDRAEARPWNRVSVAYSAGGRVVTILINDHLVWEHPVTGTPDVGDRITPHLLE